jgi:superfamily I DNA/RNA helicase
MHEELIFGPPGCGKTHTLIDLVKDELSKGTPPDRIGFVSFSKKSIGEAKERISEQTKLSLKDVPWFKTLHSTGYHWLGLGESNMLTRADFTNLGNELGIIFDGNTAKSNSDGVLLQSFNKGNQYLELIGRANMREVSLDQEYNDNGDYQLSYSFLNKVDKVYKA